MSKRYTYAYVYVSIKCFKIIKQHNKLYDHINLDLSFQCYCLKFMHFLLQSRKLATICAYVCNIYQALIRQQIFKKETYCTKILNLYDCGMLKTNWLMNAAFAKCTTDCLVYTYVVGENNNFLSTRQLNVNRMVNNVPWKELPIN